MWFFGLMFWCAVFMLFAMSARRRRWHRWAAMGPPDYYYPMKGWYPRGWYRPPLESAPPAGYQRQRDDQQAYIETLETRISQLEERLDFTERLLEGRQKEAGK